MNMASLLFMSPQRSDRMATGMRDEAEKAASIIARGGSPFEVAIELPVFFIGYHIGIIRLWEALNRRPWRGNE